MNDIILVLVTTAIATTLMTFFSYSVAHVFHQPYKEPLLLAYFFRDVDAMDFFKRKLLGWLFHYLIGLLFVLTFCVCVHEDWMTISWIWAARYGAIIGLCGILGWAILFAVSSRKPDMNYTGYYTQLFIAHLLFSFAMMASLKYVYGY